MSARRQRSESESDGDDHASKKLRSPADRAAVAAHAVHSACVSEGDTLTSQEAACSAPADDASRFDRMDTSATFNEPLRRQPTTIPPGLIIGGPSGKQALPGNGHYHQGHSVVHAQDEYILHQIRAEVSRFAQEVATLTSKKEALAGEVAALQKQRDAAAAELKTLKEAILSEKDKVTMAKKEATDAGKKAEDAQQVLAKYQKVCILFRCCVYSSVCFCVCASLLFCSKIRSLFFFSFSVPLNA